MIWSAKQFLSIRKEAGKTIDPETAEVHWGYRCVMDPYKIYPDDPEEYHQVGRAYFARSPESDIWVCFYDLPESTRDALWEKHRRTLAFPAGLDLEEREAGEPSKAGYLFKVRETLLNLRFRLLASLGRLPY